MREIELMGSGRYREFKLSEGFEGEDRYGEES